ELTDRGDPDNCGTPAAGCAAAKSDERTVDRKSVVEGKSVDLAGTPQSHTIAEDGQATVTLSGSDAETTAADLQFKSTALPAHGTLSKDGTALAAGDSFSSSRAGDVC